MKIRAKKETVVAFLKAHRSSTKLISQKSGWSTIRWIKKGKSKTDTRLKSMWDEFIETRNGNFEEKMMDTIDTKEDPEVLMVAEDAKEQREAEKAWMNESNPESEMIYQKAYNGNTEMLPASKFTEKIECKCGEIRWVQRADVFQVEKCKPCTIKERRRRQYNNRKARKAVEEGNDFMEAVERDDFFENQNIIH